MVALIIKSGLMYDDNIMKKKSHLSEAPLLFKKGQRDASAGTIIELVGIGY